MLVDLLYVCSWNEAAIVKAKVQLWHVHDTVESYSIPLDMWAVGAAKSVLLLEAKWLLTHLCTTSR